MNRCAAVAAFALAACGGSRPTPTPEPTPEPTPAPVATTPDPAPADECETFVAKSKPSLAKFGEAYGKTISDAEFADLLAECRAGVDQDRALITCVIKAADEPAVSACWEAAFQRYASSSKPEWQIVMEQVVQSATAAYVRDGAFPKGKAPLSVDCCAMSDRVCHPDSKAFIGVWEQLGVTFPDPFRLRYSIDSTPKRFEARAVMDLDCDGITFTKTVVIAPDADGNPSATVTESGGPD